MLLFGSGCRPSVHDIPPDLTPDILLDRLHSEASRLQDFKGSALISMRVEGRKGRVSSRIQFKQPHHLKIHVQGGFMQVLAVLSIHGQVVQLYIPRENTVFEGNLADSDVVIPGMRVPLSDIRTAATGIVDLSEYQPQNVIRYRWEDGMYRLTVQDTVSELSTRTIWVDPKRSVITREEEQHSDGKKIVRTFEHYKRYKNIWRPSRIRITRDGEDDTLDLTYNTQTLNSGLTIADLMLTLPRSIKHLPLNQAVFQSE